MDGMDGMDAMDGGLIAKRILRDEGWVGVCGGHSLGPLGLM